MFWGNLYSVLLAAAEACDTAVQERLCKSFIMAGANARQLLTHVCPVAQDASHQHLAAATRQQLQEAHARSEELQNQLAQSQATPPPTVRHLAALGLAKPIPEVSCCGTRSNVVNAPHHNDRSTTLTYISLKGGRRKRLR